MIRRRRPMREIPFSFDSFLDVVANVVGIIIRLILVVWVAARSYSSVGKLSEPPASAPGSSQRIENPKDPLESELATHRAELRDAQARLLELLRQLGQSAEERNQLGNRMSALVAQHRDLETKLTSTKSMVESKGQAASVLSLATLRQRQKDLKEQLARLEKLPPQKHELRFKTPVSRPVDAEEFFFECRQGRVTFIDMRALLERARADIEEKGKLLQSRWQATGEVGPVGAFRLRFTLERERGLAEAFAPGAGPEKSGAFRYGLSEWVVDPAFSDRGENRDSALKPGSGFRQIVDRLDPAQGVATFWVYPDSFALFRDLRDYLYQRDLVVAGRPLPDTAPIAFSRHGTLSRAQ
jgi:hypothetical protein